MRAGAAAARAANDVRLTAAPAAAAVQSRVAAMASAASTRRAAPRGGVRVKVIEILWSPGVEPREGPRAGAEPVSGPLYFQGLRRLDGAP
jgi:hypothetical protein